MDVLTDTISLCEECYRHIRAVKFIEHGQVWLGKACPKHGYTENLIEPDAEFYVNYIYPKKTHTSYHFIVLETAKNALVGLHSLYLSKNDNKILF